MSKSVRLTMERLTQELGLRPGAPPELVRQGRTLRLSYEEVPQGRGRLHVTIEVEVTPSERARPRPHLWLRRETGRDRQWLHSYDLADSAH